MRADKSIVYGVGMWAWRMANISCVTLIESKPNPTAEQHSEVLAHLQLSM